MTNSRPGSQLSFGEQTRSPKAAFRDIRNYLAGQHVGATRDSELLDELLKCLFSKLYVEIGAAEEDSPSEALAAHTRAVFAQVQRDYPEFYAADAGIALSDEAIEFVLGECRFPMIDATSDPVGDAFEIFVGSESKSRAGQFFTPRQVTDLLVEAVAPQPGDVVIDPACGAGGFLTAAARSFMAQGMPSSQLGDLVSQTFFGIDKDDYLARLARFHLAVLTRSHPGITSADSLAMEDPSAALGESFPAEGADVVLTNPPFGTRIVAAGPSVLRRYQLARKWRQEGDDEETWVPTGQLAARVPPQVLFVERCISLLRPGGKLGMVVPESMLSNKSYRYVVAYLRSSCRLEAVMGMPDALFKTSGKGGTHTKTCLLVATKKETTSKAKGHIFMAEASWCGQDSRANAIPHNDLPEIAENLRLFRTGRPLEQGELGFTVSADAIRSNVLCPRYYDPLVEADLAQLSESHDFHVLGDLVKEGVLELATGHELGKLAYGTGEIPFVRTSDLSNWEIKADPKHGVDRSYFESFRSRQDVRPGDIFMVRDGTYLIGTAAIVTEQDAEILYQSHIVKMRVRSNDFGLDEFLLLAILSSPAVMRQIRAKQFTLDIIDSLGDRVTELVLPIPRSADVRAGISSTVRGAIERRAEAKDMARSAVAMAASGRQD